jgi:hypothetical protein
MSVWAGTEGAFELNPLGVIAVDILVDAGAYQGQLGVFSLAGLDPAAMGTLDFLIQAATRVVSGSALGHLLFDDATQAAFYGGTYGEEQHNFGAAIGAQFFALDPSAAIGFAIIPNGTFVDFLADPAAKGASLRPLLSMAAANPDGGGVHFATLPAAGINRLLLGVEDLERGQRGADFDFNDIVFGVEGLDGDVPDVLAEIRTRQDWLASPDGDTVIGDFADRPFLVQQVALNQQVVLTGVGEDIVFRASMANAEGIGQLQLLRFDAASGTWQQVAIMRDDGNLGAGDDIAGDGTFSAILPVQVDAAGEARFMVTADRAGRASGAAVIEAIDGLTAEELEQAQEQAAAANAFFEEQFQALAGDLEAALDAAEQYLRDRPDIVELATIARTEASILWRSVSGVLMVILGQPLEGGQRGGPAVAPASPASTAPAAATATAATGEACNSAIVLGPYAWQFEPNDESDQIAAALEAEGFEVLLKRNETTAQENISLNDYRSLDRYGAVAISTHGDSFDGTSFASGSLVVMDTGDKISILESLANVYDLVVGNIVLGADTYFITSDFIRDYNTDFRDTIVYIGACRSTFTSNLADAFIDNGAAAFVGFSDYVGFNFAAVRGERLFDELLAGGTVGNVTGINSDTEAATSAQFQFVGDPDATISLTELKNGSFEDGLTCWNPTGDARAITRLGPLDPADGDRMAILSTGLGSVSDSSSTLSQRFLVAENATSLTISYDVISEEPLEYVGSVFDDQFEILLDGQVVAEESINASSWSPVSGINFAGGDATVFRTGLQTVSIDLTPFAGQVVELAFRVFDIGDSLFDTAVLLDRIEVQTS